MRNLRSARTFLIVVLHGFLFVSAYAQPLTETGRIEFVDISGYKALGYELDQDVIIRIWDADRNTSSITDQVEVTLRSSIEADGEVIILSEEGPDSGVFSSKIRIQESRSPLPRDGIVQIEKGDILRAVYTDPKDDFGNEVDLETETLFGIVLKSGSITEETVWRKVEGPFLVIGDLTVERGAALIIEPGVTTFFASRTDTKNSGNDPTRVEFTVCGSLIAEGTVQDSILFTAFAVEPLVDDWKGIRAYEAQFLSIKFARIEYGSGLEIDNLTNPDHNLIRIENSVLQYCSSGISVWDSRNRYLIAHNVIRNLGEPSPPNISYSSSGIRIEAQATVLDNQISRTQTGIQIGSYYRPQNVVTVTGNRIALSQRGIYANHIVSAEIRKNELLSNTEGIFVEACDSVVLAGNLVEKSNTVSRLQRSFGISVYNHGTARLDSNTVIDSGGNNGIGIEIGAPSSKVPDTLRHNVVRGNSGNGVESSGAIVAWYNHLYDNGRYDFYTEASATETVDIRFNWWGLATTLEMLDGSNPKNIAKIFDSNDDPSRAFANYAHWLMLAPEAPELVTPDNGTTDHSADVEFTWRSVQAESYELQLSTSPYFPTIEVSIREIPDTSFTIAGLKYGQVYYWRVRGVNLEGTGEWSEIRSFAVATGTSVRRETDFPKELAIHPTFPNPFKSSTTIPFDVPNYGRIVILVYDVLGREVACLADGTFDPGKYAVEWSATTVSSGLFLIRMTAGSKVVSRTVTLLR